MKTFKILIALLLVSFPALGGGISTDYIRMNTTALPTVCRLGDMRFNVATSLLSFCNASNTWTAYGTGTSPSGIMTTLGDMIYENATPAPARLAGNTTATKNFLTQTGNGTISAAPAWGTIAAGDVPTLNQNTTGTAANVSGVVAIVNGGTGQTTATAAFNALDPLTTKGDIITHDGTNSVRLGVGTNGQALVADSAQTTGLKWASSTATPGGSDTQVQFNDSSSFNGDAGLTYNKTTNRLTITSGSITIPGAGASTETFGAGALAVGDNSTSVGNDAQANGAQSTAMGFSSRAGTTGGNIGTAYGYGSAATGTRATAAGRGSNATADASTSFGDAASCTHQSSICLGYNSTSTATNQFLVGGSVSRQVNDIYFGGGVTDVSITGVTMQVTGGSGANNATGNFTIAGGKSTGNATPGALLFQTSTAGGSSSTLQTLSTRMKILDAVQFPEISTPGNPAASFDSLYFKSDNKLYGLNSSGTEVLIGPGGGGGSVTSVALSVPGSSILSVTGSPVTSSGTLALATTGTSGGIPYFSSTSVLSSSALLAANQLMLGGGAATTPATLGSLGTTTTVLHGNAAGAPTFGAVSLSADVSGTLPIANGGTGQTTANPAFNALSPLTTKGDVLAYSTVNARLPVGTDGQVITADSTQTLGIKWATPSAASGDSIAKSVTQTAHGFSVQDVVYYTGSAYAKAKADVDSTSEVLGVVSAVAGANDFTIIMDGFVSGLSGLTAGTTYYLSPTTAGALTTTSPTTTGQVSKPVLVAVSTTTAFVLQSRGAIVSSGSTTGGWTPDTKVSKTSTGACSFTVPSGVFRVGAVVVAGGGGGGGGTSEGGSGGGGGGTITIDNNLAVTPGQVINCSVATGGSAGVTSAAGGNAASSYFGNLVAYGGMGGNGSAAPGTVRGNPGGGSGINAQTPSTGFDPSAATAIPSSFEFFTAGTGNTGPGGSAWNGGGGAGAGANGVNGNSGTGQAGNGGAGQPVNDMITGSPTTYGGGGGGGSYNFTASSGGAGGGGAGGDRSVLGTAPVAGTANTGGGGGGGAVDITGGTGAAGGSGRIDIYYDAP